MATTSRAVLITGCSTGIGRATATHLAGQGWTVYATARRLDSIDDLAAAGCRTLSLDVTDEASMTAAVKQVEAEAGGVGVLVNNAGFAVEGALEEVELDELRRQFETNVFGLVRMCQLVLPGMRAQGWGRIVNISSMGGRLTFPGGGPYHATKYAVEALSDALRFEVRGFGVDVVVVEPGPISTEFGSTAKANVAPPGDSPYGSFNQAVVDQLHAAYEGKLSRFAAGPEAVAKVIEKAITARRPRPRYLVTLAARALVGTRAVLPDRAWDAVMRSQFPTPGR